MDGEGQRERKRNNGRRRKENETTTNGFSNLRLVSKEIQMPESTYSVLTTEQTQAPFHSNAWPCFY